MTDLDAKLQAVEGLKLVVNIHPAVGGALTASVEFVTIERRDAINAALTDLQARMRREAAIVVAWKALQDYKGDELFRPIDAFRAAMKEL